MKSRLRLLFIEATTVGKTDEEGAPTCIEARAMALVKRIENVQGLNSQAPAVIEGVTIR